MRKLLIWIGGMGLLLQMTAWAAVRPNVILIMVDDFGHECVESYGGTSYATPQLSRMAATGAQFNHAHAQNICTPSRVQIMTGQYNVRNYTRFATFDQSQQTFGHAFKEAGYATCVIGKWQLGGDAETIQSLGFDEHCLWHIRGAKKERYVSPKLLTNGASIEYPGEYGPAIQQAYAERFIRRHTEQPFFLYYPMTLPHYPFQPTPDSADWDADLDPYFNDTKYFGEMVRYMDKLVGDLIDVVDEVGLSEDTLIIFTADNGTDHRIVSEHRGISVPGAKGKMTGDATQVPFLVRWPTRVLEGIEIEGLIDFSDVFATLREVASLTLKPAAAKQQDGVSFMPLLELRAKEIRDHSYCWYMERTDMTDIKRFVQNADYKYHSDGRFIHKKVDRFEQYPLVDAELTEVERALKERFLNQMTYYDALRPERFAYNNSEPFALPGKIEAEQYDLGMPGMTYYDTTKGNTSGGFWRSDDVDILSKNNHHRVIQMEANEWLDYSIHVSTPGSYQLDVTYAASKAGAIRFSIQEEPVSEVIDLPVTKDQKMQKRSVSNPIQLLAGNHVLRLEVVRGGMHLDAFHLRPLLVK